MLHCHLEDPVLAVKQLRLGQRAGARAEISQKEVKETPGDVQRLLGDAWAAV